MSFVWVSSFVGALGVHCAPALAQFQASVVVQELQEHKARAGQTFVGTVQATQTAVVGSAVPGRVVEFPVRVGDRVEAQGTLAQLLTATIELERDAARGLLKLRKEELAELVNGTRKEEKEQLKAEVAAIAAEQEYLEAKYQRLSRIGKAAASEELEEARAAAKTSTARLAKANHALELAETGARAEVIAQAQASVEAQQALVDQLEDKIRKYTVITRFTGYITAEHTEVGEWIQVGNPIAEIAALDQVDIVAQVVEDQIRHISRGMEVEVQVPALGRKFPGTVVRIVPKADPRSRTFPVKIRVDNLGIDNKRLAAADPEDGSEAEARSDAVTDAASPEASEDSVGDGAHREPLIKAGMYARAVLPTGELRETLFVLKDALVLNGEQSIVFAIQERDGKSVAVAIPVIKGISIDEQIEILPTQEGALNPGMRIVIEGNERLRPNQEVKILEVKNIEMKSSDASKHQS